MAKRSILNLITGSSANEEPEPEEESPEENKQSMAKKSQQDVPESEGQLTIDVYQTDDEIVIVSTIAGVNAKDLDITITSDMVTVEGEREKEEKIDAEDYYYQELYWGSFSRSVVLPQEIDTDNAKAELEDGVLVIHLPKMERTKSKKLEIE